MDVAVDQDFLALKENGKTKSGSSKQKQDVRAGFRYVSSRYMDPRAGLDPTNDIRDALAALEADGIEEQAQES